MKKNVFYKIKLVGLKNDIIGEINRILEIKGFDEIEFNNNAVLSVIDDQTSEKICLYCRRVNEIMADNGYKMNKYSVTDLSLNTLLWILTEIEEGNFEEF